MYNHRPKDYLDPFKLLIEGIEDEHVESRQSDIIFQDKDITAFVCSRWWPKNPGHVLVIPNQSYENIYDLPNNMLTKIYSAARQISIAFKEVYQCGGVSLRQNNETAGDQHVWHYHLHVIPRYDANELFNQKNSLITPEEREPYAEKLRDYFTKYPIILDV